MVWFGLIVGLFMLLVAFVAGWSLGVNSGYREGKEEVWEKVRKTGGLRSGGGQGPY